MVSSLVVVLVIGLVGLAAGFGAPYAIIAWLALVATGCGAWMGRWARSPKAWAPPIVWAVALSMTQGPPTMPYRPLMAALVIAGLYAAGMGLGAWLSRERAAGGALLLVAALSFAPTLGGALERPWPLTLRVQLLDLSPVAWAVESAELDWIHQGAVYEAGGTDSIDPFTRGEGRGWVAAVMLLVVGCTLALSAKPRVTVTTES